MVKMKKKEKGDTEKNAAALYTFLFQINFFFFSAVDRHCLYSRLCLLQNALLLLVECLREIASIAGPGHTLPNNHVELWDTGGIKEHTLEFDNFGIGSPNAAYYKP